MIWEFRDQGGQFQAAISNPLPGTIAIATPLILGALAGCHVRARRRHQHRDRGPVPGRCVPGRGLREPDLQCRGRAGGRRGRRRPGRGHAGAVRHPLPGQPGGRRCRARRVRLRAHRVPGQPDPRLGQGQGVPQPAADPGEDRHPGVVQPATRRRGPVHPDAARLPDVRRDRGRPVRALPDSVGPAGALGRGAPEGRRHGRHPRQPRALAGRARSGAGSPASVAPTSPSGPRAPSTRTSPTARGSSLSPP